MRVGLIPTVIPVGLTNSADHSGGSVLIRSSMVGSVFCSVRSSCMLLFFRLVPVPVPISFVFRVFGYGIFSDHFDDWTLGRNFFYPIIPLLRLVGFDHQGVSVIGIVVVSTVVISIRPGVFILYFFCDTKSYFSLFTICLVK